MDADEAEERRRKGREYLAKRNQQMYELQQRRKETDEDGLKTPTTPTSFDAMVDEEGKLRLNGKEKELPSPPDLQPLPEAVKAEMRKVEHHLSQPLLVGESSAAAASSSGWSFGSAFANPFSDEYALDRSETPKPPVPPKVALDAETPPRSRTPTLPGSFGSRNQPRSMEGEQEELSYEEQLAIALSLSEQEAQQSANLEMSRRIAAEDEEDPDLRAAIAAAIEASLKEVQTTSAGNSSAQGLSREVLVEPITPPIRVLEPRPLVDLSPATPTLSPRQPVPRGHWETLFDQDYSPIREPLSLTQSEADDEDELYSVTPDLPRARLVSAPAQAIVSPTSTSSIPYDPVREAAGQPQRQQTGLMEASFYSAISSAPSPASSHTMDHEGTPQLVDVSEDIPFAETRHPMSPSSFGFQTDNESDSDTFASMSAPRSPSQSRPRSEFSEGEMVQVEDDSDVDMLSQEGDGINTPDSWTEVGSRDGESEMEDEKPRRSTLI